MLGRGHGAAHTIAPYTNVQLLVSNVPPAPSFQKHLMLSVLFRDKSAVPHCASLISSGFTCLCSLIHLFSLLVHCIFSIHAILFLGYRCFEVIFKRRGKQIYLLFHYSKPRTEFLFLAKEMLFKIIRYIYSIRKKIKYVMLSRIQKLLYFNITSGRTNNTYKNLWKTTYQYISKVQTTFGHSS